MWRPSSRASSRPRPAAGVFPFTRRRRRHPHHTQARGIAEKEKILAEKAAAKAAKEAAKAAKAAEGEKKAAAAKSATPAKPVYYGNIKGIAQPSTYGVGAPKK